LGNQTSQQVGPMLTMILLCSMQLYYCCCRPVADHAILC